MRFHAIGDVAITFPACTALRNLLPGARIEFVTSEPSSSLVEALETFDTVHIMPRCLTRFQALRHTALMTTRIARRNYEVVIDLQRNWSSRLIRMAARPKAWTEFDRFTLQPAGLRVLDTFIRGGFTQLQASYRLQLKPEILEGARLMLAKHGWDEDKRLIVLNPAGLWVTRNWPIQYYIEFANLWVRFEPVQFLFLGNDRIVQKAKSIENHLRGSTIDLTNKTTTGQALAILQFTSGIVSEDSGLMHMAWVSGIPTVALLGSSQHRWSTPLGDHSRCLHSGDLPCGACMEPTCRFGDVHCLTRFTPEMVFEITKSIILQHNGKQ